MTITTFTKPVCKSLGADIEAALQAVAEKHGIKIQYGGGTVGETRFTCKVVCDVVDEGALEAAERQTFDRYCGLFNLKPEHFGVEFSVGTERYRLAGLAPNRTAKPIKIVRLRDNASLIGAEQFAAFARLAYDQTAKIA